MYTIGKYFDSDYFAGQETITLHTVYRQRKRILLKTESTFENISYYTFMSVLLWSD
jgi:hypothetical protein